MSIGYDNLPSHSAGNLPSSKTPASIQTVFLDRDGVINQKLPEGEYVSTWDRFTLLPGVAKAIAQLNQANLRVLVVTNQRGVALGKYTAADVETIHRNLQQLLAIHGAEINGFYFCPHDKNQCHCRKPDPGMFHQAQTDFPDITPETSVIVGDSLSDIQFGAALGLRTIFIEGDAHHRKAGAQKAMELANHSVPTLPDAVALLLG